MIVAHASTKEFEFSAPITTMQFSSSNNYLALGLENSTKCFIINVQTWELCSEIQLASVIHCLGFSTRDGQLFLGKADGSLSVLADGPACSFSSPENDSSWNIIGEMDTSDSPIFCLDLSLNGDYLAVGRGDALVTVHEPQQIFEHVFVPQAELRRQGGAPVNTVAFGARGKFLGKLCAA